MSKKLIYVTVFSTSWALLTLFIKLALNAGATSADFTIYTLSIASIMLGLYIARFKRDKFSKIMLSHLVLFAAVGTFVALGWILALTGLKLSTSINYSFIIKTGLVFTLTFAAIFLNEALTAKKIILALILLFGTYLLTTNAQTLIPHRGDMLIVASAASFSASSIFLKKLTRTLDPYIVGFGRVFSALIVLAPIAIALHLTNLEITAPKYILLAGVALSFTSVYMNKAFSVATLSYFTMMSMMTPVINTILGYIVLSESLTSVQMFGGFIIMASGMVIHSKNV